MRGYGSPLSPTEAVTDTLTRPDWGWGDPTPASWGDTTADYGWGSSRGADFSPYVRATSTRVGDDGGYRIDIEGVWPRLGASPRQRPTGFRVYFVDAQSNEHPCYSGRAGQGADCSTDYLARTLSAYSPMLPVGDYTIRVRWNSESIDAVAPVSVERRTRTEEEYALRAALSSVMDTGPRALQYDSLLTSTAPNAEDETHSRLATLFRTWGQSLADLKASGVVTKLTQDFSVSGTTLQVESTLGMGTKGAVRIGGSLLSYTGATETTLTGVTRINGQTRTLSQGTQVTHDPHVIAD